MSQQDIGQASVGDRGRHVWNKANVSRASEAEYAVMTLNFAVSMTSLRVEMLAECSRSTTTKQGRIM